MSEFDCHCHRALELADRTFAATGFYDPGDLGERFCWHWSARCFPAISRSRAGR